MDRFLFPLAKNSPWNHNLYMIRTATGHFVKDGDRSFTCPDSSVHTFREGSGPYEYLMGALAGCFYSTLSDFERTGTWDEVTITASGVKRTTSPTTLEHTQLEIVAKNVSDKEEFGHLVQKTVEACSIYNTISCVSEMDVVVRFEDDEE